MDFSSIQDLPILPFLPSIATALICLLVIWLLNWTLLKGPMGWGREHSIWRQVMILLLSVTGILLVILMAPLSEATRGQVLSLLGIVITAVIALSSTTFVSNTMAGFMLRLVRNFRTGDFIRVGEQFGRVTERGLLHTEIQTEDRDLTTFPNMHLITNPVTVVRSSGTLINTSLSLGYDVPQSRVKELLVTAAGEVGLKDPFVQVMELGDFSVSYKVSGFLVDVKTLLSARSELKSQVLDALHDGGIEIVSPNFMNQRVLDPQHPIIPQKNVKRAEVGPKMTPEEIMFDKAENAESEEQLRLLAEELNRQVEEARKTETDTSSLELGLAKVQKRLEGMKKGKG